MEINDNTFFDYLDGLLLPDEIREFEDYLNSNPEAQKKLNDMKESEIQLKNSIIDDDIVQDIPQELLSKANDLGKKLDKSVNKSSFLSSFIKPLIDIPIQAKGMVAAMGVCVYFAGYSLTPVQIASIDGNVAQLDDLAANASQNGTCALTITVADAVTVTTGKVVVDATSIGTVDFSAAGLTDTLANCIDTDAIHGDLTAIKNKDGDININLGTINTITASQITHLNLVTDVTTTSITADNGSISIDQLTSSDPELIQVAITIFSSY